MKTRNLLYVVVIVLVTLMLVFPAPVQATAPQPLVITADMHFIDGVSAEGTFSASGVVTETDRYAFETFVLDAEEGTINGVKTLVGALGTITIKFQAVFTSPTTCAGTFKIISGTGAYKKLHGYGTTEATIVDPMTGHLVATYTGKGHID